MVTTLASTASAAGEITVAGLGAGFYLPITVTGATGCLLLPVGAYLPPPYVAPPTLYSNSPVCEGDTLLLWLSGPVGSSYTWSGPGGFSATGSSVTVPAVTGSAGGTYSVVASAFGCFSWPTSTTGVIVIPVPGPPPAASPQTFCYGAAGSTVSVPGAGILYYTGAVGGVGSALPLGPDPFTPGLDSVWVSRLSSGCESPRVLEQTVVLPAGGCDSMWPGDANRDLVVNNMNALEIALGFGDTGPSRTGTSTAWATQFCADWSVPAWAGLQNEKHLDCNGDGTVGFPDTVAVSTNYRLTHMRPAPPAANTAKTAGLPDLRVRPLGSGDVFYLDAPFVALELASSAGSGPIGSRVAGVAGVAGTLRITHKPVAGAELGAQAGGSDSSWLTMGSVPLVFSRPGPPGRMDFAIARTDHRSVAGAGAVAALAVQLSGAVAGDSVGFILENVRIVDSAGNAFTDFNVVSDTFPVGRKLSVSEQEAADAYAGVLPNPSRPGAGARLVLRSQNTYPRTAQVSVTDAAGKIVWRGGMHLRGGGGEAVLPLDLAPGTYLVNILADG